MCPDLAAAMTPGTTAVDPAPDILETGRDVLRQEAEAIGRLHDRLDDAFRTAVQWLLETPGRVVVTGIGKSGAVARKAAATLASTGTPSFYLHPAEGVHGDLGMVTGRDLVVALSYSGETEEVLAILPALKRLGVRLVAITGRPASTLGQAADLRLDAAVEREACPLNLAPTTSTTLMLALTDALAVAAMVRRRFSSDDYALFHPAGSLGRRLLLRVSDLMRGGDRMAVCTPETSLLEAMFRIGRAQAGCILVLDAEGRFLGLLSDGDIRRRITGDRSSLDRPVGETMNPSPRVTSPDRLVSEALALMQQAPPCGELPVLDPDRRPVGILNLKDVARAGIF